MRKDRKCRGRKRGFCLLCMILAMIYLLSGCSKSSETKTSKKEEVTSIPVTFLINPATNLSENQELVEGFNARYQGIYEAEVEWLTESASGYREKLKQWNVLDEMPVIITDAGFDYDFYRLLVENKRLVDLKPYMEAIPEWKASIKPEIQKECTEESGEIYLAPLGSEIKSYAGIIYNKELLRLAGYETFPETWEEFWKCLDALKALGVTPISLHGSGSYWVPMLFATSYIYGIRDGKTFLDEDFPDSYQNPEMEGMLAMLDRMYGYTFEDAVEIDYDEAAERFCDGKAAIFANGYWMIEELPENVKGKLQFAPFPGNILMNSPRMSAWAMTAGYDAKVTDGAAKLLAFRVQQDQENTQRLMNQEDLSSVEDTYISAVKKNKMVMPNYQMKWEQEIQNDFFTENLPGYLEGDVDAKTLLKRMDERLTEIRAKK
ncbi:MAG: ABC transporter substrate-binding protein [Faecalicatena sp.]|uniref:ABC transporter substrate-binding protein n=1 Tax=Faecalicatena sp. TaxID=2005360 RepID=UPI00258DA59F|nr:ABC transporter substrate-binding protein [Faecalicatena sp.]MCI6466137.1 ABC transporter substrate-binding protein [Faecalicatena sp.]MDY5619302.1 ABC transporter substrate-binding protein [Lachnospiraceae bacterium]